jgi:APA family basic amino acid/polyamine antiporter
MNAKSLFRTKPIQSILTEAELDPNAHAGHGGGGMKRTLGVVDLTAMGIAAVIGAGIFSTIGNAAAAGGPAVSLLFVFTAIACAFSAFCYAEFASSIPVSGSAYTYAYASLGEIIAWIIGWDLLMEYAIGNIAVAISWSDYFTSLLQGYGIQVPLWMSMDSLTASRGYDAVRPLLDSGVALTDLAAQGISAAQMDAYNAYLTAPTIGGLHVIGDLPAMVVVAIVTGIVYIGIQESKRVSNFMVALKIAVLLLVIGLGAFFVKPENWSPFAPNGTSGILKGVSAVFFAYIGFDAISTTAEECKNPQRDLPRSMMYSLIICTVLYIAVALVLTGIVPYSKLAVGDPLAYAFGPEGANVSWIAGVIAISAVIALFTVLLVFQLGQPRIWMAMSRDGLLPPKFSELHPKFRTPWFSTIIAGFFVGIPCMFMNLTEVTDLTSIGTLSAFVLVCLGVLRMDPKRPRVPGRFYTPYIDGKYLFPALVVLGGLLCLWMNGEGVSQFFAFGEWETFKHKVPLLGFLIGLVYLAFLAFRHRLSLIPLLGVTSCAYLMTELGWTNWVRFLIWLAVGLVVYFFYSYKNSRLAK